MAQLVPFRSFRHPSRPGPESARSAGKEGSAEDRGEAHEDAFAALMQRYREALRAFTFRLVGDPYVAEEICQDTLLKAWQQATSFRVEAHLRAWLFRVARNSAIDHLRRRRPCTEELGQGHPDPATLPEEEVERAWVISCLGEALSRLPPVYREVVELRYFQQLEYAEIARILEIPLGTVKSRLAYALNRLSKILREQGVDRC